MPDEGPNIALRAFGRHDAALRLARVNISKTYTNQFARLAKARFRA